MEGEDVNDAPDLAAADIGISMGISGSALATQTGHIISHVKVVKDVFISIIFKILRKFPWKKALDETIPMETKAFMEKQSIETESSTKRKGIDQKFYNLDHRKFHSRHCRPYSWIARMERFFRLGEHAREERLPMVAESLKGDALRWYKVESRVGFTDCQIPGKRVDHKKEVLQKTESPCVELSYEKNLEASAEMPQK
ncbi:hypothetical protein HID58_074087 [Brassica napus]|uniref:Uncharacterized protein n=1 Tax=Brassica napus TaxID=3708 RepID=A0ABQ7YFT1_BRANA|nr:hypothetical protein HID58_074087 [Brassica napus]